MRINLIARAASAQARRERTRQRLLDAAMQVIAQKGAESTSVEDLVAAAGVARGTFYNYFPTVDDLVHALNTHLAEALLAGLDAVLLATSEPRLRLAAMAHYILVLVRTDAAIGWVMLRLAGSKSPRQPVLEARFDAIYNEGAERGLFRACDLTAARALAFGAARMAQRDILVGDASPEHGRKVVALMLAAFGVAPEDADRISREAEQLAEGTLGAGAP